MNTLVTMFMFIVKRLICDVIKLLGNSNVNVEYFFAIKKAKFVNLLKYTIHHHRPTNKRINRQTDRAILLVDLMDYLYQFVKHTSCDNSCFLKSKPTPNIYRFSVYQRLDDHKLSTYKFFFYIFMSISKFEAIVFLSLLKIEQ